MTFRFLNSSKEDFEILANMYLELEKDRKIPYLFLVDELFVHLRQPDSKCFIFETQGEVIGFSIIYSDLKGGCIGQSLYIKEGFRGTKAFHNVLEILKDYVKTNYKYCDLIAVNNYISSIYEKLNFDKQYTVYRYEGA